MNENVERREIIVVHENTNSLVANFFTKAVHGNRYSSFRARIMGKDGKSENEVPVYLGDTVEAMDKILKQFEVEKV